MSSTHDSSSDATAADVPPPAPWPLVDAFAAIPDPRCRRGRRFTAAAMLTLALAAMLANHLSPFAIAQWGAEQDEASKRAMGFTKGVTPHQSTFARLFRRLEPAVLSAVLTDHGAENASPAPRVRGAAGVAIDGKAYRGCLVFAATPGCSVHALTACTHDLGTVLAQEEIASHAEKAEAELTAAPRLLARLDWRGRVLTGECPLLPAQSLHAGLRRRRRLPPDRQGESAATASRPRHPLRHAGRHRLARRQPARLGHAGRDDGGQGAWAR